MTTIADNEALEFKSLYIVRAQDQVLMKKVDELLFVPKQEGQRADEKKANDVFWRRPTVQKCLQKALI